MFSFFSAIQLSALPDGPDEVCVHTEMISWLSGNLALKLSSHVVRHSVPWSVKNISFNGDTVLFRK